MIYLLRHGLDDEIFVGGHSNVGLVNEGVMQIEEVARWCLKNKIDIKKIYSSDIYRALESAYIVSKYLDIDVIPDACFREQNKGILNGMRKDYAKELYYEYLYTDDVNLVYPEGESLMDLYLRIKALLVDISKYEDALIVTHRGVINMIYYLLNGDHLDMDKGRYNVTHGSIHQLDIGKSKIRRIR